MASFLCFLFSLVPCEFSPLSTSFAHLISVMHASVKVERKFLEVLGSGEGPFPFQVAESSRRKRSFIRQSPRSLVGWQFRWFASASQRENLCG